MRYLKEDNYYIYVKCECGYKQMISKSMVAKIETGCST